jgi:hypothetical protein
MVHGVHIPRVRGEPRRAKMEALTLTDDEVRVHLRRAVTAGIIWGWYRHLPLNGREWVVNPMAGPCVSYDRDGIRSFCEMLAAA